MSRFYLEYARDRAYIVLRFLTSPMFRVLDALPSGASLLDVVVVAAVGPDARAADRRRRIRDRLRRCHHRNIRCDIHHRCALQDPDRSVGCAATPLPRARLAEGGILIVKEQDPTARFKNGWNAIQERVATALHLTLGESFTYESPADFKARLEPLGFVDVRTRRIDLGYPHPHVLYIAQR